MLLEVAVFRADRVAILSKLVVFIVAVPPTFNAPFRMVVPSTVRLLLRWVDPPVT